MAELFCLAASQIVCLVAVVRYARAARRWCRAARRNRHAASAMLETAVRYHAETSVMLHVALAIRTQHPTRLPARSDN